MQTDKKSLTRQGKTAVQPEAAPEAGKVPDKNGWLDLTQDLPHHSGNLNSENKALTWKINLYKI